MRTKTTKQKTGRPKGDAPPLQLVTFRADPAVLAALDKLAAAIPVDGYVASGARSVAIRRALLDAAARLDSGVGK